MTEIVEPHQQNTVADEYGKRHQPCEPRCAGAPVPGRPPREKRKMNEFLAPKPASPSLCTPSLLISDVPTQRRFHIDTGAPYNVIARDHARNVVARTPRHTMPRTRAAQRSSSLASR